MSRIEAWVGLDVGSTTVKVAVLDPGSAKLIYSDYLRHNANQSATVSSLLAEVERRIRPSALRLAVCGSGGRDIADRLGAFYVQEVVATSLAVTRSGLDVRTVIELGGQDAKVIMFRGAAPNEMRMNGSCAGGTGAFIDQIAELLQIPIEEFDETAARGTPRYDISGRCGVFAKTDVQPLLHQGAAIEDIAVSSFHAIAKQTIGGLAQGLRFEPPVLFAGGPLTFNPTLVRAFQTRLDLTPDQIVIPAHPEIFVARGAALSCGSLFADKPSRYRGRSALETWIAPCRFDKDARACSAAAGEAPVLPVTLRARAGAQHQESQPKPLFASQEEQERFIARHTPEQEEPEVVAGPVLACYLGIDAGSTTTKFVLLDDELKVRYRFYAANGRDALSMTRDALVTMRDEFRARGTELDILGAATTGYGETLFAAAFSADVHQVETVAHARAATHYVPDVSFVLDIGGQDMKAIEIQNGVITRIVLNEACSAGCGSFIETYGRSLDVPVTQIARSAFSSTTPSRLGSRCTVFMNSSVITEQKNGKSREDILAGLCRSVIENVFTKVIRVSNLDRLGPKILVQGGTFRNLAVLRAMEEYVGRNVYRPPYPGEMGAIGAALIAREWALEYATPSAFIDLDSLEALTYERRPGVVCTACTNNCSRTVVTFQRNGDTVHHVTGNRCERGEVIDDRAADNGASSPRVQRKPAESAPRDLMRTYARMIASAGGTDSPPADLNLPGSGITIGIPRVLEFYRSLPYWKTLFRSLGFKVHLSGASTYRLFESGLAGVASDTVCFPAKLVHGHVLDLVRRNVDRIFLPMMIRVPQENRRAAGAETCPIVQGYPMVAEKSEETRERFGIPMDTPAFHFFDRKLARQQTAEYVFRLLTTENPAGTAPDPVGPTLRHIVLRAIRNAEIAQDRFIKDMRRLGSEVIEDVERRVASGEDAFAVVLAGRPYHADELVNHGLSRIFTRLGIPVLNLESLALEHEDVSRSRLESFNPFHTRMIAAAHLVATTSSLELVQIVSFGCGHDAILSDEVERILREGSDKVPLVLKLDEGDMAGPLAIRVRSFIETVRKRRKETRRNGSRPRDGNVSDGFSVRFTRRDRRRKTIYAPVLSSSFSYMAASELRKVGFLAEDLPIADPEAIALGKRYVHNDVCFPAQVNIGEMLRKLRSGEIDPDRSALALAKNCVACRAGQYAALARKALDDAGYPQVPIITTGKDTKKIHPGARINPIFHLDMLVGMTIADGLEEMRQTTRPYELHNGDTDSVFRSALERCTAALKRSYRQAYRAFAGAVDAFNAIPVDRSVPRPRVGIVGEILMNYHESANGYVQRYLEQNGMETILPGVVDFFRKKDIVEISMAERGLHPAPLIAKLVASAKEKAFDLARQKAEEILTGFRNLRPRHSFSSVHHNVDGIIDKSYLIGEGWLMPAEIIQMAKEGVRSFVILNPFGCMPNHITGRGMIKTLKQMFPNIQVLALDYDPDVSWGNIENRLQMLVMAALQAG